MPRGSMVLRAGPVEMHIDPPVPTEGLTEADIPELIQKVRDAMTSHFAGSDG
jgi:hypothetical protein